MNKMKFPKIFVSVLAAASLLFLGAPAANAGPGDVAWLVVQAESASFPEFAVEADVCIQAVVEIEAKSYTLTDQNRIIDRVSVLQFRSNKLKDVVFLYCYGLSNDINLFGPGPGF